MIEFGCTSYNCLIIALYFPNSMLHMLDNFFKKLKTLSNKSWNTLSLVSLV